MKKLLILIGAIAAYGTDCTISDTVRTPFGGYFAGRIVVALNSPASSQPLYSGSQTLTGWQTTIEVPASANGAVAVTLVCTDTITPAGTSYSARYQPTSGSPWSETWNPTTGTTTIRAMRATTIPTPTTTFQASQIVPGTNGQVLTTTAGASAWGSVPACATCVVTSGSYADPAWITSLAGSKVSGNIAGNAGTATALAANPANCAAGTFPLGVDASGAAETCTALPTTITGTANQITASASTGAVTLSLPATITGLTSVSSTGFTGALTGNASTATALATPRTIAGVSFNGTANISIASTNLSDTANLVRNNAANTYTAGSKQTFAHSATTAGLNVGVQAAAPSSPAQGDVFFNSTLTRKGVYDGTQWRYELYAPSSGTGVVSWDGTSLSASTTLAGLSSVTSTSFVGALTGNASTATALQTARTIAGVSFNGTANISIASTNLSDGTGLVRGAASLTTVGAIPYVSASGVLNQDATNLFWDSANARLGVGTTSPSNTLDVQRAGGAVAARISTSSGGTGYIALQVANTGGNLQILKESSTGGTLTGGLPYANIFGGDATTANAVQFAVGNTVAATLAATSGNLLIGTTTDSGYKLEAYTATDTRIVATANATKVAIYANNSTALGYVGTLTNSALSFRINDSDVARFATTGNLLIGTTTDDGSNKLQVAGNVKVTAGSNNLTVSGSSGQTPGILFNQSAVGNFYVRSQASTSDLEFVNDSAVRLFKVSQQGTATLYNETATTGNTKEVIRAGAGQSTNLTEWQNNAGTVLLSVSSAGAITSGSYIISGASSALGWNSRGYLLANADGVVSLNNNAGTDFSRLQFGGTTSSFPALKRSSAILQARLADDSAYTDIGVNAVIVNKAAPSASSDACTAGQLWAGDMGGTKYAFYCVASGTIVRSAFASF